MTFEEQIMSKDKINVWSIFSPQMKAIVFIILQTFLASCTVVKIGEYSQIIIPQFWLGNIWSHGVTDCA